MDGTLGDVSLDLFTAVFEKVPDIAVNLLGKDYTVLWANKVMALNVGRPLEELIGRPCFRAFRRRETPCVECLIEIVSRARKPVKIERWLDLPNQERRYGEVRAYPIFDKDGSVKHVFELITEITAEKKDEERRTRYIASLEETLRDLSSGGGGDGPRTGAVEGEDILTSRERQVIRLIARGYSNKEIARILGISSDTAKTHVAHIFSKLNLTDRTQAAVWAFSRKLI